MEVCSKFTSMADMQKESDAVVKKAAPEELKTLIPDPAKGALSVKILRWAMNQADSGDARQRSRWAKYREYRRPHDHHVAAYFTTRIVVAVEEGQEAVAREVEEEVAMTMIVRATKPERRSMPVDLDSGEEEETVVQPEEKNMGNGTRRSKRLEGR
ncbi:hypothetical protein VPH35_029886 [Triticum aestivum]